MYNVLETLELQNKAEKKRKGYLTQPIVSELQGCYDPCEYRPKNCVDLIAVTDKVDSNKSKQIKN
jgi:hypothetical protein